MFDMRPYRNNNDRRNKLSAYNPFREMDAFERNFFNDPFGSWFDHSAVSYTHLDVYKRQVYTSPKNVVYSEGNFFGSMATPIILIAVPPKTAMPVFPF